MAEKRSERLPCVYDVVNGLEIDIDDARLPPLREPDRPGPSSSHHLGKSTSSTPLSHKHEPIQSGLDPNWGTAGGDALPFHSRGESSSSSAVRKKEESESSHEKTTCHICQKTFKRPSDVNKHVKSVHCEKKEFVCSVCKREFARKDYCQVSLQRRIRSRPRTKSLSR